MGHVYRALALANELNDHEILFVTEGKNRVVVEAIQKLDYWLGVYASSKVIDQIIRLQPDMVVNDILDTRKRDIERLRAAGSVTVSFEDLGSGARYTDLTINEIYDIPEFTADHVLWGKEYFFLRDEFHSARPQRFNRKVDSIMATFGGTDQHDLARKTFHATRELCEQLGIFLHIVTGPGYQEYEQLAKEIRGHRQVSLTHGSEVISSIMEQVQVAVTSNGRTVYEFAHMNIPAIVIAQHEREVTHAFASEENGFVPLGLYNPDKTESVLKEALKELVLNTDYREMLHRRLVKQRFVGNKSKVLSRLNVLLNRSSIETSRRSC